MERRVTAETLGDAILPLRGNAAQEDSLFEMIGDAPIVLLGEATHGTHEFYRARADITKRLIEERGFTAVCIEGDWPDAYRVNRFIRGTNDDTSAQSALAGFARFPTWMWRNTDVVEFVTWLRAHNGRVAVRNAPCVGFYGLDLYSMYASIDAVLQYLDRVDPLAAKTAREQYACLEPFEDHPEEYAMAAFGGVHPSCREDVMNAFFDIQRHAAAYASMDGQVAEDQYFYAEQNARIVANAERYYRAMIDDTISTWNLRDAHMVDTLERLMEHLSRRRGAVKAVVWAHNSHVGNAGVTSMHERDETNIGELIARKYGARSFSIGFTTYSGTVTAASNWHAPAECKRVRAARPDSYEHVFHSLGTERFWVPLRTRRPTLAGLPDRARERAIGVIYRPETELQSHYFTARLIDQFDAVYHYDVTRAVEPLERGPMWTRGEVPETYPFGD